MPDDIEVIHMTALEYDRALQASLDKLGLTWEQLAAQAAARDFSSPEAQQLWLMAGGQGPTQADVKVERLEAALRDAYAERDQQFERKAAALRERDEARRDLAEAREERDLAIAHDRQPYPTAWAHEQAVKALETQRARANEAERELAEVKQAVYAARITHVREARHARLVASACDVCQVLVALGRTLPSRPDDPAALRERATT